VRREIVDGERELIAVLALMPFSQCDASVVDEYIRRTVARRYIAGEATNRGQRSQIGNVRNQPFATGSPGDFRYGRIDALLAATVHEHCGTAPRELRCQLLPQSRC